MQNNAMKLIIGNKNYSSWSLRAWLMLSAFEIPFEEKRLLLAVDSFPIEIKKYSPAGKVPVLLDGDCVVWDSLAICEYISEHYLSGRGWPVDREKRAVARSCAAEMHSGFFELRSDMPMNCRAEQRTVDISEPLQKDIFRIDSIWSELRVQNSDAGPYLFGSFSIADCMFAPVVFRFRTYGVAVSAKSSEYMQTIFSHPNVQEWLAAAESEKEIIENCELG